jgi:hypothetical protein
MEWSDLAKLNPRRNQCQFIQLFWRRSTNGEKSADTTDRMIGFLQANGTVGGRRSGVKRFCANIFALSRSAPEFRSDSDGTHSGIRTRLSCEVWEQNSKSCRNCCGTQLCDPHWMCTHRQSRQPSMQLKRRCCRWCFRAKRPERHNYRGQMELSRRGSVKKGP